MPIRLSVDGAQFIANAKGYDLFRITSFEAAERFVIEETQNRAGTAYTHSASTFNANISEQQHLYFFARENTNKIYGAAIKKDGMSSVLSIAGERFKVTLSVNFTFENAGNNSSEIPYNVTLPLFLIPGASFTDVNEDGILIKNGTTISAALPQCTSKTSIEILDVPDTVTSIDDYAFTFGLYIAAIALPTSIISLNYKSIYNIETLYVKALEAPATWDPNWNTGKVNSTVYGYALSDEEAERQRQLISDRIAAEREAEEAARRAEEEEKQRKIQQQIANLRYKTEGKSITIKGRKRPARVIVIPEEIEGKPVTKIEPFAFFSDETLESIQIPKTVISIGSNAFANCIFLANTIRLNKDCIIGKDAFHRTDVTVYKGGYLIH